MKFHKLYNKQLEKVFKSDLDLFYKDFEINSIDDILIKYNPKSYKVNKEEYLDSSIQAISFFSGAGGLDIGAQLAGCKVISCIDFDLDSVKTIKSNNIFNHAEHLYEDIQNISASTYHKVIKKNNPEKLILIGGPPCQPFSKAGYWVSHENRKGEKDPRNMIGNYLRMIEELKPDGFLLENVESIMHPKNLSTVETIEKYINDLGYSLLIFKANSQDFGVPQKRKRVFFFGSKKTINNIPKPTHGKVDKSQSEIFLKPYERVIDWIADFDIDKYREKEESAVGKTYYKELLQIPPGKNYIALSKKMLILILNL